MKAMIKYDDTAITLADIRRQMKNSVIKHYAEIQTSELSNLRKLKFADVDRTVPKMTLAPEGQENQKGLTSYMSSLKVEPDVLRENEYLSNELNTICDIIQKLKNEAKNGET